VKGALQVLMVLKVIKEMQD